MIALDFTIKFSLYTMISLPFMFRGMEPARRETPILAGDGFLHARPAEELCQLLCRATANVKLFSGWAVVSTHGGGCGDLPSGLESRFSGVLSVEIKRHN